jgi:hypothetical protein
MELVVDFWGIIFRPVEEVYYEMGTQRGISGNFGRNGAVMAFLSG